VTEDDHRTFAEGYRRIFRIAQSDPGDGLDDKMALVYGVCRTESVSVSLYELVPDDGHLAEGWGAESRLIRGV
jgi:hypothetical protein